MILCVTNLSYKNKSFSRFIENIKNIGFRNIEVAPTLIAKNPFTKKNKLKIKKNIEKNKIVIRSIQSVFYNYKNRDLTKKNNKNKLINYFKKIVDFAYFNSIKNISIGSCPSRKCNLDKKTIWNLNISLFRKFSLLANKKKINISIEPLTKYYGNNFLHNHNEVFKFISHLNRKNVKLLLDTGNIISENKNLSKYFSKYKKIINHIQISDKNLNNLNINFIKRSIKFLKQKNYKGTVSIEYISQNGKQLKNLSKIIKVLK